MHIVLLTLIFILSVTSYVVNVGQMLRGHYAPSFFSRGIWFLLGINSFAGVALGKGSKPSVLLAGVLLIGNAAVFAASYKKGTREFGHVEQFCLVLLAISGVAWSALNAPFVGLVISLVAHFIGGLPTILRVARKPQTEQAYHWYFFCAASILSVIASDKGDLKSVVFPIYFGCFDGLIIILANRQRVTRFLKDRA